MALLGRLSCLALIVAGLGTAPLATLEPAAAASPDAPTAVAVTRSGASYVGFASGGRLLRLGPKGTVRASVPLDQDEPVDGLFATGDGQIWVDYGTSVSLLGPGGDVLRHFAGSTAESCVSPATAYGGITVGGGRVWVADRCDDTMSVYSPGGTLLATVDLPGSGHPRGITYGVAQAGRGPVVYVAQPDSRRILAYRADRISSAARPWRVATLRRPGGGITPRPSGLAVDRFGQLTVSDAANNALYLLDTNNDFALYRTLGHPPRASGVAGSLRSPSAISQYPQDGGAFSGNLFIADTGNRRVQRWTTSGWTYWLRTVRAGRGSDDGGTPPVDVDDAGDDEDWSGPVSTRPPSIVGTAEVGEVLTCNPGAWSGGSGGLAAGMIRYSYAWSRAGLPIGASSATYRVDAGDAGAALVCEVTASNDRGSTVRSSAAVVVGRSGSPRR